MWTPTSAGVLLQRIETPESCRVLIRLFNKKSNDDTGAYLSTASMFLHLNPDDNDDYVLRYDPSSGTTITPEAGIGEENAKAITRLALDYHEQAVFDSSFGIFLGVIPASDPRRLVGIAVLSPEDDEQLSLDYFLSATSLDDGENFTVWRINPSIGPQYEQSGLENVLKAFIRLQL